MFERLLSLISFAAFVGLALLVQSYSPTTAGPLGILAVFFLLYLVLVGLSTLVLYGIARLLNKVSKLGAKHGSSEDISVRRAYYFASVIALGPLMLIAMNSVGQLGVIEVMLVAIFMFIATFYVGKRTH